MSISSGKLSLSEGTSDESSQGFGIIDLFESEEPVDIIGLNKIKCPRSGKVIAEVAFIGNNVSLYFTMFEEIRLLGFGAFATVALCRHKVDGSDYAVKKIPIGRYVSFDYERVRREVDYMSKLNHANIVRYMTSFVDGIFPGERSLESTLAESDISEEDINPDQCPCLCIVQEVCDGTLGDYIASGRLNSLCVPKRLQILKQITEGLAYLHTRDIVHGDLKADNIFVLDDVWKAGDFGLAYKGAHVQGYRNDLYHLGLIFGEVMLVTDNSVEEHSQNLFMLKSLGGVSKLFRPGVFRGMLEQLFGSSGGQHTADSILPCFGGLMKLAVAGESI